MKPIITRAEARAGGLKRFFTGKPCKHGHVAERYTFHGGKCVVCIYERNKRAQWWKRNRDKHNEYSRRFHQRLRKSEPERYVEYGRKRRASWTEAERRAASDRSAQWKKENVGRTREQALHQHAKQQKGDPQYRIKRALRANLHNAIRQLWKTGSAIDNLGCSVVGLMAYLEAQFEPDMTWANFGRLSKTKKTWQIDHFHPLTSFDLTDRRQLREACHYSNLRPMWAIDNLRKSNKTIGRKEAPYVL